VTMVGDPSWDAGRMQERERLGSDGLEKTKGHPSGNHYSSRTKYVIVGAYRIPLGRARRPWSVIRLPMR